MRYSRIRLNFKGNNNLCILGKDNLNDHDLNDPLCKLGALSL